MKLLFSHPEYFDVKYEINPWMKKKTPVDRKKAIDQWEVLTSKIKLQGAEIMLAPAPGEDLPDYVFTANAGMVMKNRAVVSSFRNKERQGESIHFYNWFTMNSYETLMLPNDVVWEGEACTFPIADKVICSFGLRADLNSYPIILDFFGVNKKDAIFAEIIDPYFYHLDVAFCPLDNESAMFCDMAFTGDTVSWMKKNIKNLISVSYDEALNFACNAVVVGKKIFLNEGISENLKESLAQISYEVIETPITEFIKAGGGVKCLALYLDRWV
jgi:N-dimethylarginine dimethylaminohydrolase